MTDVKLGEAIQKYLNEKRISQTLLSKKTGIELQKLNLALNGKRRFTFEEYELICGALDVEADEFLKPKKFIEEKRVGNSLSNILDGYSKIIVETDEENPATIAEFMPDNINAADGYRVRMTPTSD